MIGEKQLTQDLIAWLSTVFSIRFIFAGQDSARLTSQYGTVRLIKNRQRGAFERNYKNTADTTTVEETVILRFEVTFEIIIYRDADNDYALDIADKIAVNLHTSDSEEFLSQRGFGFSGHSDTRGYDETVAGIREARGNIDVTFNVNQTIVTTVDNIQGIGVDTSLYNTVADPLIETQIIQRNP